MNLPPSPLFELANKNPLIIKDNKIHTLINSDSGLNFYYNGEPVLKLEDCENLIFTEKFYFFDNEAKIKRIMSDIVLKKPKDNSKLKEDIFELKKKYNLVSFLVDDVFPLHFNETKVKKVEDKKVKFNKNKEKLLQILNSENSENKLKTNQDLFLNLISKKNSILYNLLKDKSLFIFDGNIYDFNSTSNKTNIKLLDKYYKTKFVQKLDDFEKKYKNKLLENIEQISVGSNVNLLKQTKKLLNEKKHLEEIVNKNIYQKRDIGFKKINNNSYYVFLQLEPFVLQDLDNKTEKFYKFNKCKVAVKVSNKKNRISWDWPIVLERYTHPALKKEGLSKQYICVGNKDFIREEIKNKNLSDKVHTVLLRGKKAITTGYFNKEKIVPHKHLYESCFDSQKVSKSSIKNKKMVVTNMIESKRWNYEKWKDQANIGKK